MYDEICVVCYGAHGDEGCECCKPENHTHDHTANTGDNTHA